MRNRFRMLFPFLAVLLLAPWPVAYAYDSAAQGTTVVRITPADPKTGPSGIVFGKARGSVKPGDLFYVDATGAAGDVSLKIQLSNVAELAPFLSYINLKVGVYTEVDGKWASATAPDGSPLPETVLTMRNAEANFELAGGARYRIAIDGGNFYCYVRDPKDVVVSPRFDLTAN